MNPNIIHIYYLPIEPTVNESIYNYLFKFLSIEKQQYIKKFICHIDSKLSLYSEVLVRLLANKILKIKNSNIIISKNQYGKPYIKEYPDFQFNISHTYNAIVVAVSDDSVGIDIEKIKSTTFKVAYRYFTATEQNYINEFADKKEKRFYEIWTKKEAYIKCIGKGLAQPLKSFDVCDKEVSRKIKTFEKDNYLISVCSEASDWKYEITELTEKQVELMIYTQLK